MIIDSLATVKILAVWSTLIFWSLALGVYRTFVDRIRSGLTAAPSSGNRIVSLFNDCLKLPNHERPFHLEAAALSSLQVFFGFLFFSQIYADYFLTNEYKMLRFGVCFLFAMTVERISSWMYPKKISQTQKIELYLQLSLLPVLLIRLLCKPMSLLMQLLEKGIRIVHIPISLSMGFSQHVPDGVGISDCFGLSWTEPDGLIGDCPLP